MCLWREAGCRERKGACLPLIFHHVYVGGKPCRGDQLIGCNVGLAKP